jgi:hypothetical protein
MHQLDALRAEITRAIGHGTDLIADLQAVAERFAVVLPSLAELTEAERWDTVARLCGIEDTTPERLAMLVDNLADVLAGLTTTDAGEAWLQHRLQALDAGDGDEASAA